MNNGVRRQISDSGAIRSVAVPNVKITRDSVAFWHMRGAFFRCAKTCCAKLHIALERGSRQPTTVASTMPPVLSLRHWPSIQRQAKGS